MHCRLSKQLQLDADLTLDKAIKIIRQLKTVHRQHDFLRCVNNETKQIPIDVVKMSGRLVNTDAGRRSGRSKQTICSKCGRSLNHDIGICSANDAICIKCGNNGYFQQSCRLKTILSIKESPEYSDGSTILGVVRAQKTELRIPSPFRESPWQRELLIFSSGRNSCIL